MMPSRGLHVARGKLPRMYQLQCRRLSSAPRPNLRIASSTRSSIPRTSTLWTRSIPIAIPTVAAIRYASTTPAAQQTAEAAAAATPAPETTATAFADLDTITLDSIGKAGYADPSSIPEQIGYLKQIGIDYGIGPTSIVEWVLEHMHIWGGLPWWAAIFATGASMRVILFPLFLKMSDSQARQQALTSVTKPFYERMNAAKEAGNTAGVLQAWQQISAIHKRAGVSQRAILTPMVVQGVLGFCGFRLLRAMVSLPVPGLQDGGFLWLTNLTMTDGYLLLPLLMASFVHIIVRMGGEGGAAATMPPQMKKVMLYGMPVFVFGITSIQPGAVALWFCGTGLVGMIQGRLLQTEAVRKFFNLAPLYKPRPGEAAEGGAFGALMGKRWQEAQERAAKMTGTTAPPQSSQGKNAAFMHTSYQAPKIHTQQGGKTIDTTLVNKAGPQRTSSDMVQPQKKSMFDGITNLRDRAKETFAAGQERYKQVSKMTEEQKLKAQKEDFKKRADAYEKRATGRKISSRR